MINVGAEEWWVITYFDNPPVDVGEGVGVVWLMMRVELGMHEELLDGVPVTVVMSVVC